MPRLQAGPGAVPAEAAAAAAATAREQCLASSQSRRQMAPARHLHSSGLPPTAAQRPAGPPLCWLWAGGATMW